MREIKNGDCGQNANGINNNTILNEGEYIVWTFGDNGDQYSTKREAIAARKEFFGHLYASEAEMDRLIPVRKEIWVRECGLEGNVPVCTYEQRLKNIEAATQNANGIKNFNGKNDAIFNSFHSTRWLVNKAKENIRIGNDGAVIDSATFAINGNFYSIEIIVCRVKCNGIDWAMCVRDSISGKTYVAGYFYRDSLKYRSNSNSYKYSISIAFSRLLYRLPKIAVETETAADETEANERFGEGNSHFGDDFLETECNNGPEKLMLIGKNSETEIRSEIEQILTADFDKLVNGCDTYIGSDVTSNGYQIDAFRDGDESGDCLNYTISKIGTDEVEIGDVWYSDEIATHTYMAIAFMKQNGDLAA